MKRQGGGNDIQVSNSVVSTGSDVVVSGPPGDSIVVKLDGSIEPAKTFVLDDKGKAKIPAGSVPGRLTLVLLGNPSKVATVAVVDLFR